MATRDANPYDFQAGPVVPNVAASFMQGWLGYRAPVSMAFVHARLAALARSDPDSRRKYLAQLEGEKTDRMAAWLRAQSAMATANASVEVAMKGLSASQYQYESGYAGAKASEYATKGGMYTASEKAMTLGVVGEEAARQIGSAVSRAITSGREGNATAAEVQAEIENATTEAVNAAIQKGADPDQLRALGNVVRRDLGTGGYTDAENALVNRAVSPSIGPTTTLEQPDGGVPHFTGRQIGEQIVGAADAITEGGYPVGSTRTATGTSTTTRTPARAETFGPPPPPAKPAIGPSAPPSTRTGTGTPTPGGGPAPPASEATASPAGPTSYNALVELMGPAYGQLIGPLDAEIARVSREAPSDPYHGLGAYPARWTTPPEQRSRTTQRPSAAPTEVPAEGEGTKKKTPLVARASAAWFDVVDRAIDGKPEDVTGGHRDAKPEKPPRTERPASSQPAPSSQQQVRDATAAVLGNGPIPTVEHEPPSKLEEKLLRRKEGNNWIDWSPEDEARYEEEIRAAKERTKEMKKAARNAVLDDEVTGRRVGPDRSGMADEHAERAARQRPSLAADMGPPAPLVVDRSAQDRYADALSFEPFAAADPRANPRAVIDAEEDGTLDQALAEQILAEEERRRRLEELRGPAPAPVR